MSLTHKGTLRLETDRLVLRKFEVSASKAMFNNWANDEEVTKFLTWQPHKNISDTVAVLSEWVDNYKNKDFYQWAIVLKDSQELIGSISVVKCRDDLASASVGYCIGRNWWGKGIATEALKTVVDFLFTKVNVNRISADHDICNPNSGKVMKKVGFSYEGTLRAAAKDNTNIPCDICIYSILRREYKS